MFCSRHDIITTIKKNRDIAMSKELSDVEIQARDILNEISKEAMRRSGGSDTLYHRNYLDGIDDKIFEINEMGFID